MHALRSTKLTAARRSGFTLVELLVTVSIIIILTLITVSTLHFSAQKERIPEGARSTASYLEGARDRAIFNRKPVGVRLLLDQNGPVNSSGNPTTCSSMIYIGTPDVFTSAEGGPIAIDMYDRRTLILFDTGPDSLPGVATIDDDDVDMDPLTGIDETNDMLVNHLMTPGSPTGDDRSHYAIWNLYRQRGLLDSGVVITFTSIGGVSSNLKFTLLRTGPNTWALSKDFPATPNVPQYTDLEFEIELLPTVLPNQQARELPKGVVIDLEASRSRSATIGSKIPNAWWDGTNNKYIDTLDIIFSPRGTMIGESSAYGLINLVVADVADVEVTAYNGGGVLYDMTTRPQRDLERIVTINPMTGSIYTSHIAFDAGNIPADPFKYAETGDTAP